MPQYETTVDVHRYNVEIVVCMIEYKELQSISENPNSPFVLAHNAHTSSPLAYTNGRSQLLYFYFIFLLLIRRL